MDFSKKGKIYILKTNFYKLQKKHFPHKRKVVPELIVVTEMSHYFVEYLTSASVIVLMLLKHLQVTKYVMR